MKEYCEKCNKLVNQVFLNPCIGCGRLLCKECWGDGNIVCKECEALMEYMETKKFFGVTSWRYCKRCKDYRFCDMKKDGLFHCQICNSFDTVEFFKWLKKKRFIELAEPGTTSLKVDYERMVKYLSEHPPDPEKVKKLRKRDKETIRKLEEMGITIKRVK